MAGSVSILPPGSTFVRMTIARAAVGDEAASAAGFAAQRWGEASPPARILKSSGAITASSTIDGFFGQDAADAYASAATEFMGVVHKQTIVGRLAGLRRVPPRTFMLVQSSGVKGSWVRQGRPIPVAMMTLARDTMDSLKVAAMVIATKELLRDARPDAETLFRNDITRALTEASDLAFIDPANAGVDGQTPAAVTNGAATVDAGGGTVEHLRSGIARLVAAFGGDLGAAYFVARPELFAQMAGPDFPNIGARGGEIIGVPALASRSVPNGADGTYTLTLIDPTGIRYVSDDHAGDLRVSTAGTIELSETPTNDSVTPVATQQVSLFQTGSVAIAAAMWENWRVERPGSVAVLTGITPAVA